MKASAVIGLNFGDEGKGRMTDQLASHHGHDCLVIRYNGGSQCGHTVVTPDQRHIFSHIGSGSFCGARTWLSEYFVANPILFNREMSELSKKVTDVPMPMISSHSLVTTPWDMIINEMIEDARGSNRHGSVGVGFGETIERSLIDKYKITIGDIQHDLLGKIHLIQHEWVEHRLNVLGIGHMFSDRKEIIQSEALASRWLDEVVNFYNNVEVNDHPEVNQYQSVIFEGGQGLMLDQDMGWFPHVTRSNTGLKNIVDLSKKLGIDDIDVYYMTRAYLTRHGAGDLPHELRKLPYSSIIEKTNVSHKYQGDFRYAYLNLDLIDEFLNKDLNHLNGPDVNLTIAVTCLDQCDTQVSWIMNNTEHTGSIISMIGNLKKKVEIDRVIGSYDEKRSKFEKL